MMSPLYRAEMKKITGNRLLTGCTIWIWPILTCIAIGILTLIFVFDQDARADYSPAKWTDIALSAWQFLTVPLTRLFLMGFAVTIFAAEYEHRTWKSILPGNSRTKLLLTKYLAMSIFVLRAFTITSILAILGTGIMHLLIGVNYPPTLSTAVLLDFARDLLLNAGLAFISMLIISSLAILIAIQTHSMLFGIMAGMVIVILDFIGFPVILVLAGQLFHAENLYKLITLIPFFHISNISNWINFDEAYRNPIFGDHAPLVSLWTSCLVVAVYLFGLIAVSILAFRRQDIQ